MTGGEYGIEWAGYWFCHLRGARYVWTRERSGALSVGRMIARAVCAGLPARYEGARVEWLLA